MELTAHANDCQHYDDFGLPVHKRHRVRLKYTIAIRMIKPAVHTAHRRLVAAEEELIEMSSKLLVAWINCRVGSFTICQETD